MMMAIETTVLICLTSHSLNKEIKQKTKQEALHTHTGSTAHTRIRKTNKQGISQTSNGTDN